MKKYLWLTYLTGIIKVCNEKRIELYISFDHEIKDHMRFVLSREGRTMETSIRFNEDQHEIRRELLDMIERFEDYD